ncbi:TetR/AcrR family transcriptional regulator [Dinghuibacter silviterrae]|uniref:TetR family transcriptional regulator n=1 Tax=Dinghuibacter silviterrae TaxID=1539049 RepID=A0A4V3GLS8_9BACT|nr:TetR/AcrR family transcriptional regulator [Dinghuibacter silviterrae]TDX00723.1 TetR family transcriptional regulator [Dinghuibacter silviterrae]
MGIAERRYRQKEEIRGLILETAWRQIQEEGVNALSIRKVADAIEYSVPVIYTHFESKEALLMEFIQRGYRLLREQMQAARDRHHSPAEQLDAMALAYWDFAGQNHELYRLMFGLGIPNCTMARLIDDIGTFGDMVKGVIREAIETGKHPGASVDLKFQSYWSILHGIIFIRMFKVPCEKEPCEGGAAMAALVKPDIDQGLAILKDTVAGFIYALVGG